MKEPPRANGKGPLRSPFPEDQLDALVAVLDEVRLQRSRSRPEIVRRTGLSRAVVAQRVSELLDRGLLEEGGLGESTGGRAPRTLRLHARAGHLLVADLGATSIDVAVADLSGRLLVQHEEPADIAAGPDAILGRVDELFAELLENTPNLPGEPWGIGIGVPGPVEFESGRPVAPPIMPGWDGYPVRETFSDRYSVPTWVDNDVNVMALGELRAGVARGHETVVFIKIGTGVGSGVIAGGRLHRGAKGSAGDVGHIQVSDEVSVVCRCGNVGCLEALAGGAAIARLGEEAARAGRSPFLAELLRANGRVEASDVGWAAVNGDGASVELINQAGRLVGGMLAGVVNFFNPSLIVIGGGVAQAGDVLLAAVREAVYRRSLPLATRELLIQRSSLGNRSGVVGAATMVVDQLFSRDRLRHWLDEGTPSGKPELTNV
jgi:glucokinase-like ROK family protein